MKKGKHHPAFDLLKSLNSVVLQLFKGAYFFHDSRVVFSS